MAAFGSTIGRRSMPAAIGQLGLGVIGHLYAGHLLRKRGDVVVFDIVSERVVELVAEGASGVGSARELGERAPTVVVSLPNPPAVREALTGPHGLFAGMAPGGLVIDTSTIDPDTSRAMHAAATDRGIGYLDAPVSGGEPMSAGMDGARKGNMTFIVGGVASDFERAIPTMALLGKRWFHCGPSGAGSTVKLISNLMAGLHNLVAAEAFVLGAAAGFSPEQLLEVFDGTDARSYHLTDYAAPRLARRDFEPGFSIDLQAKDHRLAGDLGRSLGVPLPLNDVAIALYGAMQAEGVGAKDIVEAFNHSARLANTPLPRSRKA
jgi:3-hydroxyisobutyrate dehydrogenase-like beta-hydroxyacid dehydrogenase